MDKPVETYYSLLGIKPSATAEQLTKAFRKLAMKHHPDRGGDGEKMAAIQEAYNCLSDPTRRAVYDDSGIDSGHASIKVDALDVVSELISEVLDKNIKDPVDHVRSVLMGNFEIARCGVEETEQKQRKMARYRGRFKKKLPGDNLFDRLVEKKIASLAKQLSEFKRTGLVTEEAIRIVSDYQTMPEKGAIGYERTVLQGLLGSRL